MTAIEHIKRPSLHEELVVRLRELIVEDVLKPGEKVPERDLCESFGVSRTPLREALKVLASEGFVVLQANRGAHVAKITREELLEAFPIIAALEKLVGELACSMIDDEDMRYIESCHDAMIVAYTNRNHKRYFKANQEIHAALIKASSNSLLRSHHRLLAARVQRARFMVNLSEDRWAEAIAEHETMMELLRKRDGAALGEVMKQHIMNKCAAIVHAMDEAEADGPQI